MKKKDNYNSNIAHSLATFIRTSLKKPTAFGGSLCSVISTTFLFLQKQRSLKTKVRSFKEAEGSGHDTTLDSRLDIIIIDPQSSYAEVLYIPRYLLVLVT